MRKILPLIALLTIVNVAIAEELSCEVFTDYGSESIEIGFNEFKVEYLDYMATYDSEHGLDYHCYLNYSYSPNSYNLIENKALLKISDGEDEFGLVKVTFRQAQVIIDFTDIRGLWFFCGVGAELVSQIAIDKSNECSVNK